MTDEENPIKTALDRQQLLANVESAVEAAITGGVEIEDLNEAIDDVLDDLGVGGGR